MGIYGVEVVAVILLNKIIVLVRNILYPFLVSGEFVDHDPTGPVQVDIYQNINSFLIRYVLHRIAITLGS